MLLHVLEEYGEEVGVVYYHKWHLVKLRSP